MTSPLGVDLWWLALSVAFGVVCFVIGYERGLLTGALMGMKERAEALFDPPSAGDR